MQEKTGDKHPVFSVSPMLTRLYEYIYFSSSVYFHAFVFENPLVLLNAEELEKGFVFFVVDFVVLVDHPDPLFLSDLSFPFPNHQ